MAGGRGFTRTAAALLLLGTAWAGYATATGWHGTDGGGPRPDAEGYVLAGEAVTEWLPGEDTRGDPRAEVWLRADDHGARSLDLWVVVAGLGDCRSTLALPQHDVWRVDEEWSSCGLSPHDGPVQGGATVVAVPPGTESAAVTLRESLDLPLTLLDTPEEWPVALAVVVTAGGGAQSVSEVRTHPPAFIGTLLALAPLLPSDTDASDAHRALGAFRGPPLGFARTEEELLVFYLDGATCGVLAVTADGTEMLDTQVPPPFAALPGQRPPVFERDPGTAPPPPGGPYAQAVTAAPDHGVSVDVRCGPRAMTVTYEARQHLLLSTGGPVELLGIGQGTFEFAVTGDPTVRAALLDHATDADP
jgi:hypothetical protein